MWVGLSQKSSLECLWEVKKSGNSKEIWEYEGRTGTKVGNVQIPDSRAGFLGIGAK